MKSAHSIPFSNGARGRTVFAGRPALTVGGPLRGRLKAAWLGVLLASSMSAAIADEFTAEDEKRWMAQFEAVARQGRELWTSPVLGTNGVVCAQCHPNAANTHPETYPKFQKQLGKVALLGEMIDWCIRNPLQGQPLALDDPKMIALQAYVTWERRGVPLAPGKH